MYYMKLLMDSDCLIKLAKSSIKESVCTSFTVVIPALVKKEVVETTPGHPEVALINENLKRKILSVKSSRGSASKGEEAVFTIFQSGDFDAVCSDDKRFIKRLRLFDVPYLTPAVLVALMLKQKKITRNEALQKLNSLSPFVSEEEYFAVNAFLTAWKES
jgi:rRNA-processing protein FCF1